MFMATLRLPLPELQKAGAGGHGHHVICDVCSALLGKIPGFGGTIKAGFFNVFLNVNIWLMMVNDDEWLIMVIK
jgi:hypothetical protein